MRALLALLFVAGCMNTTPPPVLVQVEGLVAGDDVVRGTVQSVDAEPMSYDADGLIEIETEAGEAVTVHIPARMGLCEAKGLDLFADLQPGDRIEARGDRDEPGHLRPCTDPAHFLRRAD